MEHANVSDSKRVPPPGVLILTPSGARPAADGSVSRASEDGHPTVGLEGEVDDEDPSPLGQLRSSLSSHHKASNFACGGSIPISVGSEDNLVTGTEQLSTTETPLDNDQTSSKSGSPSAHSSSTAQLSSRPGSSSSGSSSIQSIPFSTAHSPVNLRWDPQDDLALAKDCRITLPAQEDVPAAGIAKLVQNLQPATFGLGGKDVYDESYRKALKMEPSAFSTNFCPYQAGIVDVISQLLLPDPRSNKNRVMKAELYKLNVYMGPSGHFKPHVDTPRSRSQFGSLVVCLPVKHEGGALEVRHAGRSMSFEWDGNEQQIQWAAFYSDCEHEVFPVRSGHRITLTYNLYVTRGNTQLAGQPNALDVELTPLYRYVEALLDDETFLPEGGYAGFFTTHSYPHSTTKGCLSETLKGVDMALWHAFQRLGCWVCLRPVIMYPASSVDYEDDEEAQEVPGPKIGAAFGLTSSVDYFRIEHYSDWNEMLDEQWALEDIECRDVTWLNKMQPRNEQPALAYIAYGNNAESDLAYSACCVLVSVPKWRDGRRTSVETTLGHVEEVRAPRSL